MKKIDLQQLVNLSEEHAVSIYSQTHPSGPETRQDPIRFRGLLLQAEQTLVSWWLSALKAKRFLEPANELLHSSHFWGNQANGLALFITSGGVQYFCLPTEFDELVYVGANLHLTPVLSLEQDDVPFWILAISSQQVRLIQIEAGVAQEVELLSPSHSLDQLSKSIEVERGLQSHSGNRDTNVIHGHYTETDNPHSTLRKQEYCAEVEAAVQGVIGQSHAPLVLAGDRSMISIFRHACKYDELLSETIFGNPDHQSVGVLYRDAMPIVQRKLQKDRLQLAQSFYQFQQNGLATQNMEEIFAAMYADRVETLFIAGMQQVWGLYNEPSGAVEIHTNRRDDDEDLLNLLATQAISKHVRWVVLPREQMPDQSVVAAIFHRKF